MTNNKLCGGNAMADTNDYLKRYNETENNLVKPTQPSEGSDDYYKMAREQEYGLLFDKEVALENAKANALKYTQNQINAQGFGGTGYGSSMQSGIYNTYLNKANEAKDEYAENVRNINLQEQEDLKQQANDRFESVTTMIASADTAENMNQLLTDYGYGKVDDEGNFVWGEKPEGMSDDDWYQMQYYYRMKQSDLEANNTSHVNTLEGLQGMTFELQDNDTTKDKNHHAGTVGTLGEWFGEESKLLIHKANNNQLEKDCVIQVTNGRGDVIYLKWDGKGFTQTNKDAYKSASNKHTLTHKDKKNYWDNK